MQPSKGRLVQLDALRGIAALFVVFSHAVEFRAADATVTPLLWNRLNWGAIGVAAFFCISGFVVPYSFNRGNTRDAARTFLIARVARLYPAYWCSIFAGLAYTAFGGHVISAPQFFANLTMLQYPLGQPDIWGVYWTLVIELFFYASCLAAFLAGMAPSIRLFASAASICLVLGTMCALGGMSVWLPLFGLSLMYLAGLYRLGFVEGQSRYTLFAMFGFLIWVATFASTSSSEGWLRTLASWIIGVSLFVLASRYGGRVPALLIQLGAISYGIYLYHELVSGLVKHLLPASLNLPYPGFVATALGSIALASLSYKWVEHPAMRFGKTIASRKVLE